MSRDDLTDLLRSWPDAPGVPPVRIIRGEDGRPLLQRRVEMGVLQMELTGRPDGSRPMGCESLLQYFRTRHGRPDAAISEDELAAAVIEARQYLQRAASLASLGELDPAARDAAHAHDVLMIGAATRSAPEARVASMLAAQAILLRVRAEVAAALRAAGVGASAAIAVIDQGIDQLAALLGPDGPDSDPIASGATGLLRALRASLTPKLPSSQREELRRRLAEAIRAENFELAAILRDELRLMDG